MRRSFLIAPLLILCAGAQSTAAPQANVFSPCPDPAKALESAQFKRLGELPPAQAFRAVYRLDQGCDVQSIPASDRLGTFPKRSGHNSGR